MLLYTYTTYHRRDGHLRQNWKTWDPAPYLQCTYIINTVYISVNYCDINIIIPWTNVGITTLLRDTSNKNSALIFSTYDIILNNRHAIIWCRYVFVWDCDRWWCQRRYTIHLYVYYIINIYYIRCILMRHNDGSVVSVR